MQSYMYTTQKGRINGKCYFIAGTLRARDYSEAHRNARILARERGASGNFLTINQL